MNIVLCWAVVPDGSNGIPCAHFKTLESAMEYAKTNSARAGYPYLVAKVCQTHLVKCRQDIAWEVTPSDGD